jgi:DNA-binding NtrC family response regulator
LAQKDNYLDVRHFGSFARIDENGGAGNENAVNADAANSAGNGDKINSAPISDTVSTFNIKEMEEKLIIAALEETGGNRTKAAEKLGITSRTLRNKLKELKIAAD